MREAIAENWSVRLDESDSLQKRKRLYITYEKCAGLLGNALNATYTVYPLLAHTCQPPGGVAGTDPSLTILGVTTREKERIWDV